MQNTDPVPGPPAWQEWNGTRWYRNAKDGYYRDRNGFLLHIAVWTAAHGAVPSGSHVHHLDHDRSNNGLGNLDAVEDLAHRTYHATVRTDSNWLDNQTSERARQRSLRGWAKKQPVERTCEHCEQPYSTRSTYSRFCSQRCRDAFYRASRRAELGL